jgi:hypothetical protein
VSVEVPIEALRTIVATLSDIPATRIYWDGEPERAVGLFGAAGKAGKITLQVISRALNGGEEMRIDDDELEVVGVNRILTCSMRADNFLGLGEAFDLLEKIRMGLFRRSVRKALRDVGLSFVDAPLITTLDYNVDNRAISSASLDIRFSQTATDAPPQTGLDTTEFIEKVTRKAFVDIPDVALEPDVYLPFTVQDATELWLLTQGVETLLTEDGEELSIENDD